VPIESINQTFKGQLDLERHGGHTPAGVMVRVLQRVLALTAAIWHNDHTRAGRSTARSPPAATGLRIGHLAPRGTPQPGGVEVGDEHLLHHVPVLRMSPDTCLEEARDQP
jgi:hypothetical protein